MLPTVIDLNAPPMPKLQITLTIGPEGSVQQGTFITCAVDRDLALDPEWLLREVLAHAAIALTAEVSTHVSDERRVRLATESVN